MTVFQWVMVPLFALLFVVDLVGLFRRSSNRWFRLLRCVVWLAAGVTIYHPNLTGILAQSVGIQRGADLVFYAFVLAFLGVSFYFYAKYVRLQRQLTDVVRHLAIQEARKQPGEPNP